MKKEINSKSRRKWIMGGLAAFASVALLTTGFAVWVVGTTKTDDNKDVTVTVDTAQNTSISFNITLTNSNLQLKESKTTAEANKNGPLVTMKEDKDTFPENPLTLSAKYTLRFGKDYDFKFTKIAFGIVETPEIKDGVSYKNNKVNADNILMGKNNLTSEFARANADTLTYFDVIKEINLPSDIKTNENYKDGNNNYKVNVDFDLAFTWGSFFGNESSPATYYNKVAVEKSLNDKDSDTKDALTEEVTQEINQMHDELDGKTIQVKAELM